MEPNRYTHGHHDSVLRSHRVRNIENSAQYLAPRLSAGDRVLDVGCGPGTLTASIAEAVSPGQVLGIDRSSDVVKEATSTAAARGLTNVRAEVGDVYSLDYPDDSFDVVHAHQVLQHLSDPVSALREMRRVAKPGGVVAARDADYEAMLWYPSDERLDRWLEVYRSVARANDAEPDAGRLMLAWAHAAGYTDVVPTASAWCFADAQTRIWWSGLWAERMVHSPVAEQAVAEGFASADELAAIAEGFHAWAADSDSWFTVLHGEILATP